MNNTVDVAMERVRVRAEEQPRGEPLRSAELDSATLGEISGGVRADKHCSVDPRRVTDRYRLVTPYFSSSKDL